MSNRLRIVSFSGGKDSSATYLWCLDRFGPEGFRAVFADTGNEHPVTVNFVKNWHHFTGGPRVHIVKADVQQYDPKTENPFLSLCMKKGRFPSVKVRFCREHLKEKPIQFWISDIREGRPVTLYIGVRRAESLARSRYNRRFYDKWYDCLHFRPIVGWSTEQTFQFVRDHNAPLNPLYERGLNRVGCWPCIMAGKTEISRLDAKTIDRIESWERIVGTIQLRSGKRPIASWFPWSKDPTKPEPTIRDMVEWARTSHGGKQFGLFAPQVNENIPACMSDWQVCE